MVDLSTIIAATTQWLVRAYPATGGALGRALAEVQARQATTVATWLRYPTATDAALLLLLLTGPGGSGRLDQLVGSRTPAPAEAGEAWRTWVDEVVASWAACLLTDPGLAIAAVTALLETEHLAGLTPDFRRLTSPGVEDRHAAPLLRHPDLLAPIADAHRPWLVARLRPVAADAA